MLSLRALRLTVALCGLLTLATLTGCAELNTLRQRTLAQEETIKRLQKENSEFQSAYYEIKEKLDNQNVTSQKTADQMQREVEQLKTQKSQQEKDLGDQLRTRNLEYEALKTEAADQKKNAEAQLAQLQATLQASQAAQQAMLAERDAANAKVTDLDTHLKVEQARTTELSQQLAQLQANEKTLNEQLTALRGDVATRDQALDAEKKSHQETQGQLGELTQKLTEAQSRADAATSATQALASVQQEKNDLQAQLEALKSAQAQELEKARAEAAKTATEETAKKVEEAAKTAKPASLADDPALTGAAGQVEKALAGVADGASVKARAERRGLRIIIPSKLLFDENSTLLADRSGSILQPVAQVLKQLSGRSIRVEGHTDNQTVQDMPFADNWGLGFARADRVRDYLMKEGGLGGDRLTALSRAQFDPLASNDTAEGRVQNRRVEIVVGAPSE